MHVAETSAIDSARSTSSGNVALPRQELASWSEKLRPFLAATSPFLLKRGCAACTEDLCTHGDDERQVHEEGGGGGSSVGRGVGGAVGLELSGLCMNNGAGSTGKAPVLLESCMVARCKVV